TRIRKAREAWKKKHNWPSNLRVGDRVVLRREVERFPHFTVTAGMTGEVVLIEAGNLHVRMDEPIVGAEEWDNEIIWTLSDENPEDDVRLIELASQR
ncbi:MAG TPA: hypothetical protein VLA89_16580, partial [Gemmatimonadales bacterium]|nr:hypothetical protein [Gemmatimonadales bacterium]